MNKTSLNFEWDSNKALINQNTHGITFTEASTVFYDSCGIMFDDPDHSDSENRFIILGISSFGRLLIVCHCYRQGDDIIRIISAREATSNESFTYNYYNTGGQ